MRKLLVTALIFLLLSGLVPATMSGSPTSRTSLAYSEPRTRYTSGPLGFAVDLPADWSVNEYLNVGFGFSFQSPSLAFSDDGSLREGSYITVGTSNLTTDSETPVPASVTSAGTHRIVGGKPAVQYVSAEQEHDEQTVVDIYDDHSLYRFTLHYDAHDEGRAAYHDVLELILDSLVFVKQEGKLPVKAVDPQVLALGHTALAFPFEAGNDWKITDGGGYNNGDMHQGYALYALDFQRSNEQTAGELALAPTSGILSWKETTAPQCIDVSIREVTSTDDLYLQICHIRFESYLGNGSPLAKGQVLGLVEVDGCGGYCTTVHIHMAAFIGKKGNPWTDPVSMTAVPFVTEYDLAMDGRSFPPDGSFNQWGGTCCYSSSLGPICPVLSSLGTSSQTLAEVDDICNPQGACPEPSLRDPVNGHIEHDDRTLTFRWDDVSCDHDGFTFRVKTVPDMESGGEIVVDEGEGDTERVQAFDARWDNRDLYWSVRAANAPAGADWAPSRVFRIDPNAPPTISFDTANGDSFPSGRIESRNRTWTFQGTASDSDGYVDRVEFRCGSPCDNTGSGPGQTGGGNWSLARTDMLGRNDLFFVAYDNEGANAASRHLDLNIDLAAPSTGHNLAGTLGHNGWYISPVEVHLHANDGCTMNACAGVQEIRYRIDGGAWQSQGGSDKYFTVSSDGSHTVEYYAVDEVGNIEGIHSTTFRIDRTPPTAPGAATEAHGVISAQWQKEVDDPAFTWLPATDAQSGLWYYRVTWNDTLQVASAPAYDPPAVGTGSYPLSVKAVDRAGNVGPAGAAFTFRYDGTPPHAPAIENNDGVPSGMWQNEVRTADFSWATPHDDGSGIAGYNVYWGPEPEGTSSVLTTDNTLVEPSPICAEDEAATYYLRARSQDNVGWQSQWVAYALAYDGAPPTATLIANYGQPVVHQTTVHLDILAYDEGSGVAGMRLTSDPRDWPAEWQDYTDETYWQIPAIGRRDHPIYLQVVDGAGNVSEVVSDTVYLEVNAPAPKSDNYWLWDDATPAGGAEANSPNYTLRSSVGQSLDTPALTSLNYAMIGGYQAGALAEPTATPTYTVYLQLGQVVASGGTGATTLQSPDFQMHGTLGQPAVLVSIASESYLLLTGFWGGAATDPPPPGPPLPPPPPPPPACESYSLSINDGALATSSPQVTLNLCGPDATDVMLSNDSSFGGATWQPYTTTVPWTLDVDGQFVQPRFVYSRFRDSTGAIHGTFLDDILYDPNAPEGEAAFDLAGLLPTERAAQGSSSLRVTNQDDTELFLSALDDSSGLAEMQVSLAPDFSAAEWQPYSAITPVTFPADGTHTVYARFRDRAGNVSGDTSDSLIVDTTPPSGTASVLEKVVGSNTISVTMVLSATDSTTGVAEARVSARETFTDTLWQPYTPLVSVPILYTGQPDPTLFYQFRDVAGNESEVYTTTYLVDTSPPVLYLDVAPGVALTRTLTILAYDELADLGHMWLSNDPKMLDDLVTMPYMHTITWTFDERRVVWVQLADTAGNVSEPYPAYAGDPFIADHLLYLPLVLRDW